MQLMLEQIIQSTLKLVQYHCALQNSKDLGVWLQEKDGMYFVRVIDVVEQVAVCGREASDMKTAWQNLYRFMFMVVHNQLVNSGANVADNLDPFHSEELYPRTEFMHDFNLLLEHPGASFDGVMVGIPKEENHPRHLKLVHRGPPKEDSRKDN